MFTRSLRTAAAWFSLSLWLFAFGMMSAQACVSMTMPMQPRLEAAATESPPPCFLGSVVVAQNLCKQHCQTAQQTLDAPELPKILAADFSGLLTEEAHQTWLFRSHLTKTAAHGGSPPVYLLSARLRV